MPTATNDDSTAGQLLTVRQTSVFLGVSMATVYRMLAGGRLPVTPIRIGQETRLSRRQLERWLDDPTAGGDAAKATVSDLPPRQRKRRATAPPLPAQASGW